MKLMDFLFLALWAAVNLRDLYILDLITLSSRKENKFSPVPMNSRGTRSSPAWPQGEEKVPTLVREGEMSLEVGNNVP